MCVCVFAHTIRVGTLSISPTWSAESPAPFSERFAFIRPTPKVLPRIGNRKIAAVAKYEPIVRIRPNLNSGSCTPQSVSQHGFAMLTELHDKEKSSTIPGGGTGKSIRYPEKRTTLFRVYFATFNRFSPEEEEGR